MAAAPPPAHMPNDFVALTKADLHLHLVGSAAPHTVATLAAIHPEDGVAADLKGLRSFYAFSDFEHFLHGYTAVSRLVRTGEDLLTLVGGLADDLAEQGTAYAEVTVTPYAHRRAGIAPEELAWALEHGARRARGEKGVELAFVYDISTFDGEDGARFTLEAALRHAPVGLVGFGLGGPEDGVRRADYAPYFAAARAAGLHSVPHAGESVGPSEVYAALDLLGAERIGHGIAAASDDRLLARLVDEGVTLKVCPSSNVATGVVAGLAEHPLPRLLEAGVAVVLCSDDPPMFNTTLPEEYRRARDVLGLSGAQLRQLARHRIEASFAPAALKRRLLEEQTASATRRR